MANDNSTNLTTLDFDSIKSNLKEYLKSQTIFQDYDFEGSNINVLLDILAYNTNLNAFYLNMVSNEMFLDSALLRDSVISHAKELNYLPRSFRSATANVNITVLDSSGDSAVLIPRGTSFTGTAGNKNFSFVTGENIRAIGAAGTFVANNVLLYEGSYTSDSYVVNYENPKRYLINNKTVDTNSVIVTVIEDNGATTLTYLRGDTLLGLDSTSQIYFIQAAENETYEILFGDGVLGRRPKNGSVVNIQYRKCNGELPNGIKKFTADGDIGTAVVTKIDVNAGATGGSIPESITSIKQNAPRAFTLQERVVTAKDYEDILKTNFSEINAASAYGGEELDPPRFGKVVIAVDLKTADELPPSRRDVYTKFIRSRCPLSIDPIFTSPDYTYVKVNNVTKYNINQTSLSSQDIESLVVSAIQNFNQINLNGFNKTLYYSKFISAIDNSQVSIVSNNTEVFALKVVEITPSLAKNYDINFGMAIQSDLGALGSSHSSEELNAIESSLFSFNGRDCFIEDDGNGILRIMTDEGGVHTSIRTIGTVNYETGFVQLEGFKPDFIIGEEFNIFARPQERDITSQNRTILRIRDQDISTSIQQVRI